MLNLFKQTAAVLPDLRDVLVQSVALRVQSLQRPPDRVARIDEVLKLVHTHP